MSRATGSPLSRVGRSIPLAVGAGSPMLVAATGSATSSDELANSSASSASSVASGRSISPKPGEEARMACGFSAASSGSSSSLGNTSCFARC